MTVKRRRSLVLATVILAVALIQGSCLFLGFNTFWDQIHVFQNPFQSFLSLKLAREAFSVIVEAEYAPLRMISNSFDYTFWGLNPFGHHLSSFILFLIDVLLVFILGEELLRRAGKTFSQCLAAAALTAFFFGIHPHRVETVAWITPREYLLCLAFYLSALRLYLKWVGGGGKRWYWGAVLCALGAGLSQPFSVSLPAALLVLDYFPLRRFRSEKRLKILAEKIPFAVIALLTAAQIIRIRRQVGIIHPADLSALFRNLIEIPGVIAVYLYKTIFPLVLAPIYPIDQTSNPGLILFSAAALAALIVLLVIRGRKWPGLTAGCLFFLVALLPNGGLLRSGATVLADRYTSLAALPIYLGLAGLVVRGVHSVRFRLPVLALTAGWVLFLVGKTVTYTGLWDDSVALTRQAYDRWPESRIIEIFMLRSHTQAALNLVAEGETEKALRETERALEIRPDYPDAYLVKAHVLQRAGRDDEALRAYRQGLRFRSDQSDFFLKRGVFFGRRGDLDRAEAEFIRALQAGAESAEVHYNLGVVYELKGEPARAEREFRKALALNPASPEISRRLSGLLEGAGRLREAGDLSREAESCENKNHP